MSKPLKILLIIVAIIAVLAAAVLIMQKFAGSNLEKIAVMTIEDVDLSAIPDGTYTGAYKAFPISVETEVTVSDHAITAVDLIKHVNGRAEPPKRLQTACFRRSPCRWTAYPARRIPARLFCWLSGMRLQTARGNSGYCTYWRNNAYCWQIAIKLLR